MPELPVQLTATRSLKVPSDADTDAGVVTETELRHPVLLVLKALMLAPLLLEAARTQ